MPGKTRAEIDAELIERAWKDPAFKQRLLADPTAVYEEVLGQNLAAGVVIKVVEETPTTLFLVLPASADSDAELSDAELDAVSGGQLRPSLSANCTLCIPCATTKQGCGGTTG